nr:hypothetical protein CFP56_69733 [Quercus suber]
MDQDYRASFTTSTLPWISGFCTLFLSPSAHFTPTGYALSFEESSVDLPDSEQRAEQQCKEKIPHNISGEVIIWI